MSLYRKRVLYPYKIFKRNFFNSLKKLFECNCSEFRKLYEYSFSGGKADISPCRHIEAALEAYSAVSDSYVLSADFIYFVLQYAFKSEMTWTGQFKFIIQNISYSALLLSGEDSGADSEDESESTISTLLSSGFELLSASELLSSSELSSSSSLDGAEE